MTNLQYLYKCIEDEYYGMRDEWREYEFEDIMLVVEKIARLKSMYNYIVQHEPFSEEQAEFFAKMKNPLQFICDMYMSTEKEINENFKRMIDNIESKIMDVESNAFGELRWKIHKLWEEFQNLTVVYVDENDIENVVNGIMHPGFRLNEYDSKVLLQFRNPLLVLASEMGKLDEPFSKCVERAIENLNSVDLLTYKHKLDKEHILPETRQRHDAIVELMNFVPDFDFQTAMRWLNLNRSINECMLDSDGEDNPYREFLEVIRDIKEEHGNELLQKVFDVGEDIVIQPVELVEVAKYLADGGDIDRVSELVDDDFFLVPYEEQKQGGMNLC